MPEKDAFVMYVFIKAKPVIRNIFTNDGKDGQYNDLDDITLNVWCKVVFVISKSESVDEADHNFETEQNYGEGDTFLIWLGASWHYLFDKNYLDLFNIEIKISTQLC